ncbi:MAG: pentapeptide repeat-containing protein [Bacteroidota bacterium]
MTDLEKKDETAPIDKISDAIRKINEGYSELSKLDPIKSYKEKKLWKTITIVLSIISGLLVYQQYIDSNLKSRSDNLDQTFLFSMNSLESKSPAVQVAGINNLYNVAFEPTIVEANSSVLSPLVNLWNTFSGKKEYKYIDKAKNSFKIFAQLPREPVPSKINPVSSEIIKTAVEWQNKEQELFDKTKNGTEAWMLYKAKLNNAYCPNIQLSNQWFFDTDFSNSYLIAASFKDSYLEKVIFSGSDISSGNFNQANLNNAKMDSCRLNFGIFKNIQGIKIDFSHSRLEQAVFTNSNLKNSIFDNAIIQGINFSGADLTGSSFRNCNFQNVDLDHAIIKNVDLSGANMEGVINYDKAIK